MVCIRSPDHPTRGVGRSLQVAALVLGVINSAWAQNRGVYPLGMNATNSGSAPAPGLTYLNLFILYSRDESRGADGEVVGAISNSVIYDLNTFYWATRKPILAGARFATSATVALANNSLTTETNGAVSGGGGYADSYIQPVILGWEKARVRIKAVYAFLAPTGRFTAGARNNVGSGYWTNMAASGQSLYLTRDRRNVVTAFEMYEFHGTQEGTTFDLDYSITHTFALTTDTHLQFGLVGYEQRQTSDKRGPGITAEQAAARYAINAIGLTANINLPARKASVGVKYLEEFANQSTFQGYAVHIFGALVF